MKTDDLTLYTAAFVDELARSGVKEVVISPGSRSTPLAILLAEHPTIEVWINIDERSAAYFALGIAKASKHPVALLCTSGTAAANYFPAVVEAKLSRVPLVVLTADRPHELRDIGAPQAIDQIDLFGSHVKWFVEMAVPEKDPQMLRYARVVASRAVSTAVGGLKGPVHLNIPFREPLVPNLTLPALWDSEREDGQARINVIEGTRQVNEQSIDKLLSIIHSNRKGIIIAGPLDDENEAMNIVKLSKQIGYPLLADPLSQIRSGSDNETIIECYDAFLKDEQITNLLTPNVIIRFGAMPVSKALFLYIKKHHLVKQIVVDEGAGWRDPSIAASEMIYANPSTLCNILSEKATVAYDEKWISTWSSINNSTKKFIQSMVPKDELFEGAVIASVLEHIPDKSCLFIGNSMPIRDLDTFYFTNPEKELAIYGNRGANGIDGIISSALGVATKKSRVVLVLGDLTFFHDLNGLLVAKQYKLNLTIILINNNGGGIFSFLPQSKLEHHFEALFGTPTNLDFEHVVKMYDGIFTRVDNWETFRQKFDASMVEEGLHVIEIPTNRQVNHHIHRELWDGSIQHIKRLLEE